MEWTQAKLYTTTEALDLVTGYLAQHGMRGWMIEDAADFAAFLEDTCPHWDYIEEDLMRFQNCETAVIFYLPDTVQGLEQLQAIHGGLEPLRASVPDVDFGRLVLECDKLQEEDWETAWKAYYHPVKVGQHMVVCPCWEDYEAKEDEVVLLLDPGMAFGTGAHETTRLCLAQLEKVMKPGVTMLDVGTGSGILATAALLLGAESAVGVDIDALAVKIAGENAALNGVEQRLTVFCGDLTEKVEGKYDIICANIVADVILRLCPQVVPFMHDGSLLLVSGIIEDRCEEIAAALEAVGLKITEKSQENDWVCFCCQKNGKED